MLTGFSVKYMLLAPLTGHGTITGMGARDETNETQSACFRACLTLKELN